MAGSESGLLAIGMMSDSEDSSSESKTATTSNNETQGYQSRADKTAQSEADFQAVRAEYKVKLENGELWKTIKLPLAQTLHKLEAQDVLHAVEELYFYRRYDEAVAFVRKVLGDRGDGVNMAGGLDDESRALLRTYEGKCIDKMAGRAQKA